MRRCHVSGFWWPPSGRRGWGGRKLESPRLEEALGEFRSSSDRVFTKGVPGCTLLDRLSRTWDIRVSVAGPGRTGRAGWSGPQHPWDQSLGVEWGARLRITWGKTLEITFSLAQCKRVVVLPPADCFSGSVNAYFSQCLLQCTRSPCLFNVT